MEAGFKKHVLNFKQPGGTSRGILKNKETYFLILRAGDRFGIGECGLLKGLSIDDREDYEAKLQWVCNQIHLGKDALYDALVEFPSIQFGLETAFRSLNSATPFELFPSGFTEGKQSVPINGLVWMGDKSFMKNQIAKRLEEGFTCIKMKVGAINFDSEVDLLKSIRNEFSAEQIQLRVDANGAFQADEALEKLKILSDLELHSIEQPIQKGQWEEMAKLCENSPVPVALDEELIGVFSRKQRNELLEIIKPHYIILKPSLIGGYFGSDQWISLAEKHGTGWWITSALESNIGLNAISQYTFLKNNPMPQGLGTGSLYTNNIASPLEVKKGALFYNPEIRWGSNVDKEGIIKSIT